MMFQSACLAAAAVPALASAFPAYGHIADKALSAAKYAGYAYLVFQCVRPILRRVLSNLLPPRIIQPDRTYLGHCRVGAQFLLSTGFGFALWLASRVVHSTGVGPRVRRGYECIAGRLKSISRFPSAVRSAIGDLLGLMAVRVMGFGHHAAETWRHILDCIDYLFVEACSQLGLAVWPCVLSRAVGPLFPGDDIKTLGYDPSIVSKYPLTLLTGVVTLFVLRGVLVKGIRFGGLAFSSGTYVYAVAVSRLVGLVLAEFDVWVLVGLSVSSKSMSPRGLNLCVKYTLIAFLIHGDALARRFIRPRMSLLRLVKGAFGLRYWFARVYLAAIRFSVRLGIAASYPVLQRATCLLLAKVLVPVGRLGLFELIWWGSKVCIVGRAAVAAGRALLGGITLLWATCLNVIVQLKRHWKATKDTTSDGSPEEPRPDSPSLAGASKPGPSEGVSRLALLISAYLDDSVPAESIEALEAQIGNGPSMHAPPSSEPACPPTPYYSVPTTPVLAPVQFRTPVPASTRILAPEWTEDDEDEDVLSLTRQLAGFSLALDTTRGPRGVQQETRRSPINFEAYRPLSNPGPVTPPRKKWTYREWERGAIASFCLGLVAPVNQGLQERNLARVNAGYVVDMIMRK